MYLEIASAMPRCGMMQFTELNIRWFHHRPGFKGKLLQCHSCWQGLSLEFVSTYYCSLWTWVLPLVNVYRPFMSVYSTSGLLIICIISLFLHSTMYPFRYCNALLSGHFPCIDVSMNGSPKCWIPLCKYSQSAAQLTVYPSYKKLDRTCFH